MPVHNERLDQDNRGSHPLQGKVAVVTGGAGAIGSAVVARLGPEGVRVVAVDQSRPTDPATGVNYLRGDIAHPVTAQHAVATAEAAFGGLDLLVNAATAWHRGGLTDTDITCWNRLLAVNLTGTLLACQAAVPAMARRGGGVIVNLGSTRPTSSPTPSPRTRWPRSPSASRPPWRREASASAASTRARPQPRAPAPTRRPPPPCSTCSPPPPPPTPPARPSPPASSARERVQQRLALRV